MFLQKKTAPPIVGGAMSIGPTLTLFIPKASYLFLKTKLQIGDEWRRIQRLVRFNAPLNTDNQMIDSCLHITTIQDIFILVLID